MPIVPWSPPARRRTSTSMNPTHRRACRQWVRLLGDHGWLRYSAGGVWRCAGDARFARAGDPARDAGASLAAGADSLIRDAGPGEAVPSRSPAPRRTGRYLARGARRQDRRISESEPEAGSDVGAMSTTARFEDDGSGDAAQCGAGRSKTGPATADCGLLLRFCQADPSSWTRAASRRSSRRRHHPGLDVPEQIHVMAPHPLATLRLEQCRVPASAQLGPLHGGFKLAMRTLDIRAAPRLPPWAWRGALSTQQCPTRPTGRCSASAWRISS